jgi:prephenate dehydrogenase
MGATLSDVGSVKKAVIEAHALSPEGVLSPCALLPEPGTGAPSQPFTSINRPVHPEAGRDRAAVEQAEKLWQGIGATDEMDADRQ